MDYQFAETEAGCQQCIHCISDSERTCLHNGFPKDGCYQYRTKNDGLNLSSRSDEEPGYRLPGTWNHQ